jgi:adenine-specific DNA-methyltransferase
MAKTPAPTNDFDHLVEIFVPTICRCREPLPDARLTEVLDETKAKMSEWFGGGSVKVERIEGFWGGEDGTTVEEPVYLVFSNTSADKLEDYREDVMAHTAGIANRLTQEATALRIDGKMYQFPSTGDPKPHRCGGGSATARTAEPRLADKNTRKRFLQAALQRVDSLTGVRDVFCNHLHYEFADDYLPTPNWPDGLKQFLAPGTAPRMVADQNGFRIIYLQLADSYLRKGHERLLIQRLIKDDPALRGLVVVSDVAQKQWNLVNVKFSRDGEAGKKSDRMLLRRMRVGPGQPVRTAVERLIEVDVEILGEDKDAAAIQDAHDKAFDVEAITRQFFTEIADWYFWALPQVKFPNDTGEPDEKVRATSLIRMLTRLIFCWFLREKKLVPPNLFDQRELARILKDLKPGSCSYYQGILQNLFFATLNQRMGKDKHGRPYRAFACDEGFEKNRSTYGVDTLYRYEEHFREPGNVLDLFADIPFLNGGLFECLDRTNEDSGAKIYIDGFSRNTRKRAKVPNDLFFAEERTVDLSEDFGDARRRREKVRGLLRILHSYNFTIEENTPVDEEVALDPELLGKVFENLLASYNEETKTTARKQTGSFYTPRPIVDYMVDESLKAHLTRALVEKARMKEAVAKTGLDQLFTYSAEPHQFSESAVATLITAIDEVKILDPACGSGAFPMGALHKLVHILGKLDPDNERWKQTQLAKLDSAAMREVLEASFADNNDDYGRKLYLIENCLYGVDIQPIAIQITKLRFFISLICDQKTNRSKKDNHGIRPLPNLETKFVAANTLIGLPIPDKDLFIESLIAPIEKEIEDAYHGHFTIQRRDQKLALQKKIKALRLKLAETLASSLGAVNSSKAKHLAEWDPFDPQSSADFFDPHWMFGRSLKDGFDLVIGNPPYISVEKFARTKQQEVWRNTFRTFAARGDIYCFFYERGLSVLREGGILGFITSNKFQKAGYGKALRQLLAAQRIEILVDFCELPVFEASTDPIIVIASKATPAASHKFSVLVVKDEEEFGSLAESVATRGFRYKPSQLKAEGWSLEGADGISLVEKLRSKGTPLIRYVDGRIYYGIKTGLNEAFVINQETRDRLVRADKKSVDLIKPWIRGKDIKRWTHEFHDLYVIIVRFGFHTELRNYPAIRQHLVQFEEQLRARGQCRTSRGGAGEGQHHWLELDNNPSAAYISAFDEPKIVFNETSKCLHAYIDTDGNAINKTGFIILTPEAPFVLTILNSTALDWLYRSTFPAWGDVWNTGRVQFRGNLMNQVPIPAASAADKAKLTKLAERAAKAATTGDTSTVNMIERGIDEIVYRLFDLTPTEITQIETALANTRASAVTDEANDDE